MGRGLVAVQVSGADAELERSHRMLDEFEAGPADEVVELVAPPEPEFAPDVRDLFVTEPEAVEEWEAAGAEPWVVAEPAALLTEEFAGVVESAPFEVATVDVTDEPVSFAVEALSFDAEAVTFETEPVAYDLDQVPSALEPGFVEPGPGVYQPEQSGVESGSFGVEPAAIAFVSEAYGVEPDVQVAAPTALEGAPVVDAAAESFAWSPWAQEMGLGEAAPGPVTAPESGVGQGFAHMVESGVGQGFADVVEDRARPQHTDAFPVPQAPVAGSEGNYPSVDGVAQLVPQPRDHGEGLVEPQIGVHAASAEYAPIPDLEPDPEGGAATPEPAPDPLAGGLLAHLMSSVRGL
jgi:hypothetical protein